MAANFPSPNSPTGWVDSHSANDGGISTKGIEFGMTGMKLVSEFGGRPPPALSGSSLSTSEYDPSQRHHSPSPYSVPGDLHRGTPPPSTSPRQGVSTSGNHNSGSRPPGLGGPFPSPIGKTNSANNTATSSPLLTLTPASSVDGSADYFNLGRQNSPFPGESSSVNSFPLDHSVEGGRHLPRGTSPWSDPSTHMFGGNGQLLQATGHSDNNILSTGWGGGLSSTSSFEGDFEYDDGLRGLGALRERAQSSPGPMISYSGYGAGAFSSSPPIRTDGFPYQKAVSPLHTEGGFRDDLTGNRNVPPDPRRPRTLSRDGKPSSRPPLSGGGSSSHSIFLNGTDSSFGSSHGGDRSFGGTSASYAPNASTGYGHDGSGNHDFGGIPRTEMRYSTSDFVLDRNLGSRGRSFSLGTVGMGDFLQTGQLQQELNQGDSQKHSNERYRPPAHIDQSHLHKFGSLPNLSSHVQQHRPPPHSHQHPQFNSLQPTARHVRSLSQPGRLQQRGFPGPQDGYDEHSRYGQNMDPSTPRMYHGVYFEEGEPLHGGASFSGEGVRYVPSVQNANLARSASVGHILPHVHGMTQRSTSLSQPSLATGYENAFGAQARNSYMQNGQGLHPALQRRDALDFMDGQNHSEGNGPIMATQEEMRLYGVSGNDRERRGSGSYSQNDRFFPQSQNGGIHNRHHSDGGATLSFGSNDVRGLGSGHMRTMSSSGIRYESPHMSSGSNHGPSSFDDDLAHPLAGEDIDDPEDDTGSSNMSHPGMMGAMQHHRNGHTGYGSNEGAATHPLHQTARHSFSSPSSLDQMSPVIQYNSVESQHLQQSSMISGAAAPRVVYTVKFKRTQRTFVAGPRITRDLEIGCYVKVEADRGEDLGIVIGRVPTEKLARQSFRGSTPPGMSLEVPGVGSGPGAGPSGVADMKRIVRLATHDEVGLLTVKREEEEDLLKVCRGKVRQRGLPMHVVDAEYQFDRHKLTFFFEAEGRIDFRELVRDLFSMYKTRIWMQQLDKNVSGGSSTGVVTSPTGGIEYNGPGSIMSHLNDADEPYQGLGPAGINAS